MMEDLLQLFQRKARCGMGVDAVQLRVSCRMVGHSIFLGGRQYVVFWTLGCTTRSPVEHTKPCLGVNVLTHVAMYM